MVYKETRLLPTSDKLLNRYQQQATGDEQILFKQFELSKPMPSTIKMSIAWQAMAIGFKRYEDGLSAEKTAEFMQHIAIQQWKRLSKK
ncbi:hypothetical protein [Photobacterium angustum]|uniref:hypothetical protein n=1 Tax=Photobacterium angustum TaxID=661 RepID=UPI000A71180C|nr:hypothetical protein [Photobacterium angustum]